MRARRVMCPCICVWQAHEVCTINIMRTKEKKNKAVLRKTEEFSCLLVFILLARAVAGRHRIVQSITSM